MSKRDSYQLELAINSLDALVTDWYNNPELQRFVDEDTIIEYEEIVHNYWNAKDNIGGDYEG